MPPERVIVCVNPFSDKALVGAATGGQEEYVAEVRRYYDRETPAYLSSLGPTLQAGRYEAGEVAVGDGYRTSNLELARRAGIRNGERILDAGCGVCGPAVDIAIEYPGLHIDAITISPVQVAISRERVHAAKVGDRVQVQLADYHQLPFEDARFDRMLFLESSGYAYNLGKLFGESHRVLRPGGTLYIKDVFRDDGRTTVEAMQELSEFNEIYRYRTRSVAQVTESISAAGFAPVNIRVFTGEIQTHVFSNAMIQASPPTGEPVLTDLGRHHFRPFRNLPVIFAQILAERP